MKSAVDRPGANPTIAELVQMAFLLNTVWLTSEWQRIEDRLRDFASCY